MSADKWKDYRVDLIEMHDIYYREHIDIKLMVKYIRADVTVDELSKIMGLKEQFIATYADSFHVVNVPSLTTPYFVWLMIAIYFMGNSYFNIMHKPFAVVLRQDEEVIDKLIDAVMDSDWTARWKVFESPEIREIRERFAPSGTGRLGNQYFSYYLVASDMFARARDELTYLDDIVPPKASTDEETE